MAPTHAREREEALGLHRGEPERTGRDRAEERNARSRMWEAEGGGAASTTALEDDISLAVECFEVLLERDVMHAEPAREIGEVGSLTGALDVVEEAVVHGALPRREVAHALK